MYASYLLLEQCELAGLMIMRAYHDKNKDSIDKIIVLIVHGTNPAASVAGFNVEIKSNDDGTVNIEALKAALNDTVAGLMLTSPNTQVF